MQIHVLYFDSGTGRKEGVEVRVTNQDGKSVLEKLIPKEQLSPEGNFFPPPHEAVTNNFGELLGAYIALKIALKEGAMTIYGDSQLILKYWSKGHYNKKNKELHPRTIELIERVAELRQRFEKNGGQLVYVSGKHNKADLGFH